jgi:Protein of unknown function (DUF1236)
LRHPFNVIAFQAFIDIVARRCGTLGKCCHTFRATGAPYTRLAQASPDAAGATTNNLQGVGLTASHKRIIYDNIASEQAQTVSGDLRLAVGSTIPDSLMLNSMPIAVKDQIGLLLRDFKFVKVTGDNILIVDPASRKIVDIITKQEAGQ